MGKMGNSRHRLGFSQESPWTSADIPRFPHDLTDTMADPSASHATPFRKLIAAKDAPDLG